VDGLVGGRDKRSASLNTTLPGWFLGWTETRLSVTVRRIRVQTSFKTSSRGARSALGWRGNIDLVHVRQAFKLNAFVSILCGSQMAVVCLNLKQWKKKMSVSLTFWKYDILSSWV